MASGTEVMELLVQLVGQLAEARQGRDEERRRCADLLAANETHQRKERDALDLVAQHLKTADNMGLDINRLERQKAALEIEVTSAHAALAEARKELERLSREVANLRRAIAPSDKRNMT